ncbi:MATE family efflux transporter [Halostagnicola sp. A-GB9-2]|uniref:MATE family efflux transporter n=1 Tax=Halostagnicola sp. A-GB9-2 TaxID=3048066 RepID=UPI0024C02259|nr:MATE family efflux transporter [Halostagnicola sp. A-GB9-2]MDJ1433818.1 MATE family efflux transporter [Halostagnicola sp. A-GB9-2]
MLAVLSVGGAGLVLFFATGRFVRVFSGDPETVAYATRFAQIYPITAFLFAASVVLSGSLRGGSDTVTPFIARLTGTSVFLLGISYIGGIVLEYGIVAVYIAIVVDYIWQTCLVSAVYYRKAWISRARSLMVERESITSIAADKDE